MRFQNNLDISSEVLAEALDENSTYNRLIDLVLKRYKGYRDYTKIKKENNEPCIEITFD